ncbi:hypothetical protein ACFLX2_01455 [Candidatus Dependentiae bacterium]
MRLLQKGLTVFCSVFISIVAFASESDPLLADNPAIQSGPSFHDGQSGEPNGFGSSLQLSGFSADRDVAVPRVLNESPHDNTNDPEHPVAESARGNTDFIGKMISLRQLNRRLRPGRRKLAALRRQERRVNGELFGVRQRYNRACEPSDAELRKRCCDRFCILLEFGAVFSLTTLLACAFYFGN